MFLKDRQDVVLFEKMLEEYCKSQKVTDGHISLVRVYDLFYKRDHGIEIFYAFLDLKINLIFEQIDLCELSKYINDYPIKKYHKKSLLKSRRKFYSRMQVFHYVNIIILRYRAIWDKLFGVFVLVFWPQHYNSFRRAKSKRRYFLNLAKKDDFPQESYLFLKEELLDFENIFRTPEIHGSGNIYRWLFAELDKKIKDINNLNKKNLTKLFYFYNVLNNFIYYFAKSIDCSKKHTPANINDFYMPTKSMFRNFFNKVKLRFVDIDGSYYNYKKTNK